MIARTLVGAVDTLVLAVLAVDHLHGSNGEEKKKRAEVGGMHGCRTGYDIGFPSREIVLKKKKSEKGK